MEKMATRSRKTQKQGSILNHLSTTPLNTVCKDNASTVNNANTRTEDDNAACIDKDIAMAASPNDQACNVTNADLKELILRMETTLTRRIDSLQEELTGIKEDVKTNSEDIADLKESVDTNAADIKDIVEEVIPELNKTCDDLDNKMEKEMMKRDLQDRKLNLIFHGIDEMNPSIETPGTLVASLRRTLEQDFMFSKDMVRSVYFIDARRLPPREKEDPGTLRHPKLRQKGPYPVLVRFGSMLDRDFVLAQQRKRPFMRNRKPVMAYPDLPPVMNHKRGKLLQHAKTLRQEGKATRIRVVGLDVLLECRARNNRSGDWSRFNPEDH